MRQTLVENTGTKGFETRQISSTILGIYEHSESDNRENPFRLLWISFCNPSGVFRIPHYVVDPSYLHK